MTDDNRQRFARITGSDGSDRIARLGETFVPDQAQNAQRAVREVMTLKPEAEEIKPRAGLTQIDDPGFGRVQGEAGLRRPLLHVGQGVSRFISAVTEDHESSRPGESHPQPLTEPNGYLSAHSARTIQPLE